jgi:5'(3')-deoxyribonucleotidase
MKKPTIAVDLDDVLSANVEGFIKYSNKRWGTHLTIDDYEENWAKVWQLDHEETNRRAEDFHKSGVVRHYNHYQEAEAVLESLAKRYKLVIVTSRRTSISTETKDWISHFFPNIFSQIYFSGIYERGLNKKFSAIQATKANLVQKIGADYLIDDQPKHCFAAAEVGVESVLFGEYPWNRDVKLVKGVARCKDWPAVQEYFNGRG